MAAEHNQPRADDPGTIELPAPTPWPIVAAFGVALLFAGLVTSASVSILGAILMVCGWVGWFCDWIGNFGLHYYSRSFLWRFGFASDLWPGEPARCHGTQLDIGQIGSHVSHCG